MKLNAFLTFNIVSESRTDVTVPVYFNFVPYFDYDLSEGNEIAFGIN